MAKDRARDPGAHLPLKPAILEILISLGESERHGYALLADIAERTGGGIELFPAQLYRHIRSMAADGLIEETEERPAPELDDERRRYYRVTPVGQDVARAELRRLEEVLRAGRSRFRAIRRTS